MADVAYCTNGHSVPGPGGATVCPQCAAPLYAACPNGHSLWLSQGTCPVCGADAGAAPAAGGWAGAGAGVVAGPGDPLAHEAALARLPSDRRAYVERVLAPGERLLWAGRPDPSVRFTRADALLVPMSIFFAAFSVLWESSAATGGAGPFFELWGIPFVAMGGYMTVGRFVWKARRKRQTSYILTDRRAAVLAGGDVAEVPWAGEPAKVTRHGDGRHVDVVFERPDPWTWPFGRHKALYANTGMELLYRRGMGVAFYDVADGDALAAAMGQRWS